MLQEKMMEGILYHLDERGKYVQYSLQELSLMVVQLQCDVITFELEKLENKK